MQAIPRWLPPVLVAVSLVGLLLVAGSLVMDQGSEDWYGGRLGGSGLYLINVAFARVLPFLAGLAVALALLQRERRKSRTKQRANGDSVVRHGVTEVATHWLNAVGIGIGLITAALLLDWFDNPLSLEVTYMLHLVGAGMTVAAVAHHISYHVVGGGFGLIPRSWSDVKDALAELVGYLGVYRGLRGIFGLQLPRSVRQPIQRVLRALRLVPDPAGKYLATEKVISYPVWAVLIGVLMLTGIVKSLHYVYPMPGGLRQSATFLHDGATIFVVVFLVIHVGALVLVPRNWPLLKSMFTTRISRRYAERQLPEWEVERVPEPGSAAVESGD